MTIEYDDLFDHGMFIFALYKMHKDKTETKIASVHTSKIYRYSSF